jgi:hypothetical protein
MHQVMGAADLVNAKLAILNEKAGNINQVVTTIVKVADQTNLLSLNAAIEPRRPANTAAASPWWPPRCAAWPTRPPWPPTTSSRWCARSSRRCRPG